MQLETPISEQLITAKTEVCHQEDFPELLFTTVNETVDQTGIMQDAIPAQFIRERNEFFDLALHDLQSPVRKLNMLLERLLLQEDILSPLKENSAYLQRIKQVAAELGAITGGLAALYDAEQAGSEYENCDLNVIVQQALQEVMRKTDSTDINVQVAELPLVKGNFKQLVLLFTNLLHNAFKFRNSDNTCNVEIDTAITDNRYLLIKVKDDGIGFKEAQAEKIFEPFTRLHGKSTYPGSGLGLAVCKKIAQKHGGDIYAESTGAGCTVSIILPENISL